MRCIIAVLGFVAKGHAKDLGSVAAKINTVSEDIRQKHDSKILTSEEVRQKHDEVMMQVKDALDDFPSSDTELPIGENVTKISEMNFAKQLAKGPIIIAKMTASCPYCQSLNPLLSKLGTMFDPPLRFGRMECTGGCPWSSQMGFNALTQRFGNYPELVLVMPSAKNNTFKIEGRSMCDTVDLPMTMTRYYGPRTFDSYLVWASIHSGSRTTVSPLWWQSALTVYHYAVSALVAMLLVLDIRPTADGRPWEQSYLKDGGTIAVAGIAIGVIILCMLILGCCYRRPCCKRKVD